MRKLHQRDQVDKCSINDLLKCLKQLERDTSTDNTDRSMSKEDRFFSPAGPDTDGTSGKLKHAVMQSFNNPIKNYLSNPLKPNIEAVAQSNKESTKEGTYSSTVCNKPPTNTGYINDNDQNVSQRASANTVSIKNNDETALPKASTNTGCINSNDQSVLPKSSKEKENENIIAKTKLCSFTFQPANTESEMQKERTGIPKSPTREILKRQDPIRSKNSSDDSSHDSDKTSKDKAIEMGEVNVKTNELCDGEQNMFRSISIQRSPCADTLYTSAVHIVIPKPKVDKATQVTAVEITAETGWDILEGMYLLLRRISIKVPTSYEHVNALEHTNTNPPSGLKAVSQSITTVNTSDPKVTDQGIVCNKNLVEEKKAISNFVAETSRRSNDPNTRNMNHVDDWLERNREMMNSQANLQPVRQMTIETVDSGFDDNPANFNRTPRWSLPLIRSVNGHLRVRRRPYSGQKMFLPAKLVLSSSSQSQAETASIGKPEKGDEADDEYDDTMDEINFNTEKLNLIRRRRHFSRRVDSFSLSDSELETKNSSYKRNRRGWKDVLIVNRLVPKKNELNC